MLRDAMDICFEFLQPPHPSNFITLGGVRFRNASTESLRFQSSVLVAVEFSGGGRLCRGTRRHCGTAYPASSLSRPAARLPLRSIDAPPAAARVPSVPTPPRSAANYLLHKGPYASLRRCSTEEKTLLKELWLPIFCGRVRETARSVAVGAAFGAVRCVGGGVFRRGEPAALSRPADGTG